VDLSNDDADLNSMLDKLRDFAMQLEPGERAALNAMVAAAAASSADPSAADDDREVEGFLFSGGPFANPRPGTFDRPSPSSPGPVPIPYPNMRTLVARALPL